MLISPAIHTSSTVSHSAVIYMVQRSLMQKMWCKWTSKQLMLWNSKFKKCLMSARCFFFYVCVCFFDLLFCLMCAGGCIHHRESMTHYVRSTGTIWGSISRKWRIFFQDHSNGWAHSRFNGKWATYQSWACSTSASTPTIDHRKWTS